MTCRQQAAVDTIVERLTVGEKAWAATTLADRRRMLLALRKNLADAAVEWVEIARGIKGLPGALRWSAVDQQAVGGAVVHGALAETLEKLEEAGSDVWTACASTRHPATAWPSACHRTAPSTSCCSAVPPGEDLAAARCPQTERVASAQSAHAAPDTGRGTGAGGREHLLPGAAGHLQQLYAANRAVVLKLNPVTDPLHPVFERIFAPFIEARRSRSSPATDGSATRWHTIRGPARRTHDRKRGNTQRDRLGHRGRCRSRQAGRHPATASRSPASSAGCPRSSSCPANGRRRT